MFKKILYENILPQAPWLVAVLVLYKIVLTIPLPPQFESRGILFTDEILLIVISLLSYLVFQQKHWKWKYVGLFLTLLVFVLPLLRLWETAESTWNIILGLLPWADAESYYLDANRLIDGERFSAFSGRRPIFASLLAVLLKLSHHNLQLVLIIFAAINGVAVFLFALEIQGVFGSAAAAAAIYFSQFFYRPYIGTTLTEQLGFPLGLLAFAILLRSTKNTNIWLFSVGWMLLTFSLLVRAGAFFTLPLLLWFGVHFFIKRGYPLFRTISVFAIVLIIPIVVNTWLGRSVASPTTVQFGNFSHTLYGQAVGGQGWTQVIIDHPELGSLKEPNLSREIYRLALDEIARNPLGLMRGTVKAWKEFILPSFASAFSFLTVGNRPVDLILQVVMTILFLLGIWWIWRERQKPVQSLILVSLLGLFLSIPFLPPIDAGIRPYAATIAIMFLPTVFTISKFSGVIVLDSFIHESYKSMIPVFYGLCLIIVAVFGGYLIGITARFTNLQAVSCSPEFTPAHIRVMPGSYIRFTKSDSLAETHVPVVLLQDVLRSFDEFPYGDFASVFRKLKQPALITITNDLSTGASVWVIAPLEMADFPGQIISACAKPISSKYPIIQIETFEIPQ